LIVVVVLLVGGFFAWRFFNEEIRPAVEDGTSVLTPFSETPPGPCVNVESENGVLASWNEVSCDGPRHAEVTYSAAFNDGPFPGDEYLEGQASGTCRDAFEGYVGVAPEQSSYEFSWIVPTEETWAAGSRHGICVVVAGDGDVLTGVVKGSGE
jgi:hypothetical protein